VTPFLGESTGRSALDVCPYSPLLWCYATGGPHGLAGVLAPTVPKRPVPAEVRGGLSGW
jgi:hypothetical protein